jgi:GNAT superfamily N-acetyltransferase
VGVADVQVVRADAENRDEVRDVRLRALEEAPHAFASSLDREKAFDDAEWLRRVTTNAWFLARADGRTVGLACGIPEPDDENGRHLVGMWVEPAFRGRGLSDLLVAAVMAWTRREGAETLALWVVDGNDRALGFYERVGFEATGERQPLPGAPEVMESRMRLIL